MPTLRELLKAIPADRRMRDVETGELWTPAQLAADAERLGADGRGLRWVGKMHRGHRFIGCARGSEKTLWLLVEADDDKG